MPLNSFVSHLPVYGLLLPPVLLISWETFAGGTAGRNSIYCSAAPNTIIGSFREEREAFMPDRFDYEILAKFRELTPENQEVILAYLAEVLSEPAASSSDRR